MRLSTLATCALAALVLFSCDHPPTAPRLDQLSLDVVSGDGQTGVVGTELAPLIVKVTSGGNPVVGQILNFRVVSGGGSVYGGTELTDNDGIAQELWTLGTNASQRQKIEVRAVESSSGAEKVFATFTATAVADKASVLSIAAGNNQTATAGGPLAIPPAAQVTDQYGNPISGATTSFAVTAGGGAISNSSQITGANGIASAGTWTLGTHAGTNAMTATAVGLTGSPVTFNAIGTTGGAAQLILLSGSNQSASPGSTLPQNPTVQVVDANGNGVPNVALTFTITGGGGSINGVGSVTTLTSSGNGSLPAGAAAVSWSLGPGAGANTLQATAVGLTGSPLTFNATAVLPPTITSFSAVCQNAQICQGATATITSGTSLILTAVFSGGNGAIDHGVGTVTSGTPISTTIQAVGLTVYTLTVTNSVGVSITAKLTVTVVLPPIITSFAPAASTIISGSSTTLTVIFSGGAGTVDQGVGTVTSGTAISTGTLTATTTYTLTVTNAAGATAIAKVTVTVLTPQLVTGSLYGPGSVSVVGANLIFVTGLPPAAGNCYSPTGSGDAVMLVPSDGSSAPVKVDDVDHYAGNCGVFSIVADTTYLYWLNYADATIKRRRLDLSDGAFILESGGQYGQEMVIDRGDQYLYWHQYCYDYINRTPAPSGGSNVQFSPNLGGCDQIDLAIDANFLYWTDPRNGTINEVSLTAPPQTPPTQLVSGEYQPHRLAVTSSTIYWLNAGTAAHNYTDGALMTAPLAGGSPVVLAGSLLNPVFVVVDGSNAYVLSQGTPPNYADGKIYRVPLAGGSPTIIVDGQYQPGSLAHDAGYVYWSTNNTSGNRDGSVWRLAKPSP